ncbi:MAG: histidine--tRNA ligase [Ignavibacteria bacterium]
MKYQKPRGTRDVLPKDIQKWNFVEKTIREVMGFYNYSEIRTPTFEQTELFTRGVGNETDIVGKEMYTFADKGGKSLTLKPEMTAPVVRAYLENGMSNESPVQKLYYISNMFRYEKPQEGRFREHTQFGAEIIGSNDVNTDIEIILVAREVYNRAGIDDVKVKINSIGKSDERKKYLKVLKEYLRKYIDDLSDDSKKRLEKNTLRILDSKDKKDVNIVESAPKILDHLTSESRKRFDKVVNGLTGLNINYEVDFRLVRGIDYYTDTTFEFISYQLGAQDAIGGGGRYDGLVELLGGKPTPGVGFGSGVERIIMVAEKNKFAFPSRDNIKIYIITLNETAKEYAVKLANNLRNKNIGCDYDFIGRSLKSQMREANRLKSEYVFIIGDEELKKGKGILKKMSDGSQNEIDFNKIFENLA